MPIERLLARARRAIDRHDPAAAMKDLNAILEREPRHGLALVYRGHLIRERGDIRGALADWRRVPDEPARIGGTARYLEGTVLLEMHRAREAERVLSRAVQLHPTYLPSRERLLELYVAQLRPEETRATLAGIRRLRPWSLAECALQVLAGKPFREADAGLKQMKAFAAADPHDVESRLAVGRYQFAANHFAQAIATARELLAAGRNDRAAALLIGALLETAQQSPAEKQLRRHPLRADSPVSLWRAAGRYALATEDWPRAVDCFRQVVHMDRYDVAAHYSLGTALARSGRAEDAARTLKAAAKLDQVERQATQVVRLLDRGPKLLVPTAVDVAELLLELRYDNDAEAWFQQALRLAPGDSRATAGYERCRQRLLAKRQTGDRQGKITGIAPTVSSPPSRFRPAPADAGGRRRAASQIRLRDVQAPAGIDFQYFNGHSGSKYIVETVGGGVAVMDYDLDGRPDIYFPQGAPLPPRKNNGSRTDRLYRNRGDGSFGDVTASARLGDPNFSLGAAVGDYDNDGFPDLLVANFGRSVLYRNNGDGTFSDVSAEVGFQDSTLSSSAAFADFDNDGLLDLYVVNYVTDPLRICRNRRGEIATCDPQNFAGAQDRLFRNLGDGRFEDVTAASGIVAAGGKGLGIVTADFDGDGRTDIYVANDGTPNFLFQNVTTAKGKPRFVERGLISGTAMNDQGRSQAGMGVACADFAGNGRLDLFVTNFYRESNTLYLNRGRMLFVDATPRSGLAAPSREMLGFGTQAVDLDLDGRPDLVVANGDIDDYRAQGRPWKMRPQVFANLGGGRFVEVGAKAGPYFQSEYLGRGVARLDFNDDGRPDLVVVHYDRPAALLKNATEAGHGVVLELHGVESNRDAVGAQIRITASGRTQLHEICGGDGFSSCNERRQFVGLGPAKRIELLEIRWPGGRRDRWNNLPADVRMIFTEGSRQILTSPNRSTVARR